MAEKPGAGRYCKGKTEYLKIKSMLSILKMLKDYKIFGRRYFYPLICQFSPYKGLDSAKPGNLPVAEKIVKQVICLPIYPDLPKSKVGMICNIIQKRLEA